MNTDTLPSKIGHRLGPVAGAALLAVLLLAGGGATRVQATAAILTVNSTADTNVADGVLDLREAMLLTTGAMAVSVLDSGECAQVTNSTYVGTCSTTDTIGTGSPDIIQFSSATFPPSNNPPAGQTITLASTLPAMSDSDTVDGSFAGVAVDGGSNTITCFSITGSSNSIYGLVVVRDCTVAFDITGASNTIGTINDSESDCADAIDDDGDGFVNDGCGGQGARETGANCANTTDDDADSKVNDGCPQRGGGIVIQNNHLTPGNTGAGIKISGEAADNNEVLGSYIGTSINGVSAASNDYGIEILAGADDNNVGGGAGEEALPFDYRNLISYNTTGGRPGLLIDGAGTTGNQVLNSFFGTDIFGFAAQGNEDGVVISGGATGNTIGDPGTPSNVISGNIDDGVVITGSGTSSNEVLASYIGTGASADSALGNGDMGVLIGSGASDNTVTDSVISANGTAGVNISSAGTGNAVKSNYIGTTNFASSALGNSIGVLVYDSPSVTIGGSTTPGTCGVDCNVISGNYQSGVSFTGGADSGSVTGNFIGVKLDGTALGNSDAGVRIDPTTGVVNVGDGTAAGRNVISGNDPGIWLNGGTDNQVIKGNYIGVGPDGTTAIPNFIGIELVGGASGNSIGGAASGEGNVIANNTSHGIALTTGANDGNFIYGNTSRANGGRGILITSGSNNIIGGLQAGQANTIFSNTGAGVAIAAGTGNTIRGNSIYGNGANGIDLGDDGGTANDAGDGDTGANNLMNFPLVTSVSYNGVQTTITGTLDTSGLADAKCTPTVKDCVDVYSSPGGGNYEGRAYLGQATPDGSGNWQLIYSGAPPYETFTATATDSGGSTSEFTSPSYAPSAGAGLPLISVAYLGQAAPAPVTGTFVAFGRASLPGTGGDIHFWAATSTGAEGIFRCDIASPAASDCVSGGNTITTVVAKGDPTPIGGTYATLGQVPVVNASGDITFFATVSGGSAASGIFRIVGGVPSKVVAAGDATPIGGTTYSGFTAPLGPAISVINDSGDISFFANLSPSGEGIFVYRQATGVTKVAATGGTAPTGGTYLGFTYVGSYGTVPIVSGNGQVTFWARVSDAAGQGIFLWDNGLTSKIAAGGDTMPGGGATYVSLGQAPIPNNAGQVSFSATLSTGVTCTNLGLPCGMFVESPAGTTTRLLAGDPGPAAIGGTVSGIDRYPIINTSGEIAVWTGVSNGMGGASQAIVRYGSSTNVAAIGNSTPIGGTFSSFIDLSGFPTVPLISSAGQVVFYGAVSGGSGAGGLFTTVPPTLGTPVIHMGPIEGATAPGTNGGTFGPNFDLSINGSGQAVFQDSIIDSQTTNAGVFMFFAGSPTPVALQNSPATGGDIYNSFGAPVNNDTGQIAYRATLNGDPNQQGLYLFFAGAPHQWARTSAGPGNFQSFGDPAVDANGNIAAQLTKNDTSQHVYMFFAGSPTVLASGGTSDGAGDTFATVPNTFGRPSGAGDRRFTYTGKLGAGSQEGLYLFFAGSPYRLAKTGTSVGGFTFTDFTDPVVNVDGSVIVTGTVSGQQGLYLFTNTTGSPTVTRLAKVGDAAPGGGTHFDFASPVETNGSQSAAVSVVAHSKITGGVNEGLFLFFAGSPTATVVKPGDHPVENTSLTFSGAYPIFPYHAMNTNLSVVFVGNTTGVSGSSQGVFFASLDQDTDGVADARDNCPVNNNATQANTDQTLKNAGYNVTPDGQGDACDTDIDGDNLANTSEPTLPCRLLPDCDGDGFLDGADNCPTVATPWSVPVGDGDCDGYPSSVAASGKAPESFIGTLPATKCASTATPNDEPLPDAWPPDFDDNQLAGLNDITKFGAVFNAIGPNPPYSSRYDFNGDVKITLTDITQYAPFFNEHCT